MQCQRVPLSRRQGGGRGRGVSREAAPRLGKGSKEKEPEELSRTIPSCGDFAFSAMNLFAFPGPGNCSCAPPALLRAATGAAPA